MLARRFRPWARSRVRPRPAIVGYCGLDPSILASGMAWRLPSHVLIAATKDLLGSPPLFAELPKGGLASAPLPIRGAAVWALPKPGPPLWGPPKRGGPLWEAPSIEGPPYWAAPNGGPHYWSAPPLGCPHLGPPTGGVPSKAPPAWGLPNRAPPITLFQAPRFQAPPPPPLLGIPPPWIETAWSE